MNCPHCNNPLTPDPYRSGNVACYSCNKTYPEQQVRSYWEQRYAQVPAPPKAPSGPAPVMSPPMLPAPPVPEAVFEPGPFDGLWTASPQTSYERPAPSPMPSSPPEGDKPNKMHASTVVLLIISVMLIVGIGGWLAVSALGGIDSIFERLDGEAYDAGEEISTAIDAPNQDLDLNLANVVAEKAMPSIVTIYTYAKPAQSSSHYDILDFMLGYSDSDKSEQEVESVMTGLGSGVVIRDGGYIVTNNHVVQGADEVMVAVGDETYEGTIIGADPASDLAVVKIDPGKEKIAPIATADSDALRIGDWVMAIGAPLGYEQSATTGIVSALGRDTVMDDGQGGYTIYAEMIQTDAAINSGNSGGALVDDEARLIGINTLVAAGDWGGQADNLGFAIPVNYALFIANQLIDNGGVVAHALLGVTVDTPEEGVGAVVTEVVEGSAAEAAGIQAGDVIIMFDEGKVSAPEDVIFGVRASQPGDEIPLTIVRGGQESDIVVVLGSDAAK